MFDVFSEPCGPVIDLPPGAELVPVPESPAVGDLDDAALVEAIAGWERLASRCAAAQLAAIAELARRRPLLKPAGDIGAGHGDRGHPGVPTVSEFAVDEIAAALRLSRPAAGARLHLAVELAGRLAGTAAALRTGKIDIVRARAVVEAPAPLDDATARAVEERVLPRAPRQTAGQLRACLARAVLAVDPVAAEVRHERAAAGRRVAVTPLPDGMAELWALLPADGAVAVRAAVEALARRSGPAHDRRGMDARRADALVDMAVAVLAGGAARPAVRAAPRHRLQVSVTVPATTALGWADEPGELSGYGPVPPSMARRLAAGGAWRRVTTDPRSGAVLDVGRSRYAPSDALADLVRTRDQACRFPGCRQPSRRCDLDHIAPFPAGPTTAANLTTLCRHHHRLKHQAGWRVEGRAAAALHWTSPTGHRYVTRPPAVAPAATSARPRRM